MVHELDQFPSYAEISVCMLYESPPSKEGRRLTLPYEQQYGDYIENISELVTNTLYKLPETDIYRVRTKLYAFYFLYFSTKLIRTRRNTIRNTRSGKVYQQYFFSKVFLTLYTIMLKILLCKMSVQWELNPSSSIGYFT